MITIAILRATVLLLVTQCVTTSPTTGQFHQYLKRHELKYYFGVHESTDVPDYTVVEPIQHSRSGRETTATNTLRYQISAFDEEYLLDLEHYNDFLSPGFHVQHVFANGSTWLESVPETPCYRGNSLNHNDSKAYISIINGQLIGFVTYDNATVVIIPVQESHHRIVDLSGDEYTNPHIVYTVYNDVPYTGQLSDGLSRVRRSAYDRHYLELHIVVDLSVARSWGDELNGYIMAILNGVAGLYADPSLGVDMELFLNKMTVLEDESSIVDGQVANADTTLRNFRDWMKPRYQVDAFSQYHFDAAAFITRADLYSSEDGNFANTGLGYKYGACNPDSMYSVNEDSGPMALVLTLAHELGHNLGMHHDGNQNECPDKVYIMSGYPVYGPNAMKWSTCSSEAIIDFLNTEQSSCLNNYPTSEQSFKIETRPLPGLEYDSDTQCQLLHGYGGSDCTAVTGQEKCEQLSCYVESKDECLANNRPPLDGTSCGYGLWCLAGQCVQKPLLEAGEEEEIEPNEEEEEFIDDSDSWLDFESSDEGDGFGAYIPDGDEGYEEGKPQTGYPDENQYGNTNSAEGDQNAEGINDGEANYPIKEGDDQTSYPIQEGDDQTNYPIQEGDDQTNYPGEGQYPWENDGENTNYGDNTNYPEGNPNYPQENTNYPEENTNDQGNENYPWEQNTNPIMSTPNYDEFGNLITTAPIIPTTEKDEFIIGWFAGPWSNCSAECGMGNKTREVVCALHNSTYHIQLEDSICEDSNEFKPAQHALCNEHYCILKNFMFQNEAMRFGSIVLGASVLVLASILVLVALYKRFKPFSENKKYKYTQLTTQLESPGI